MQFVKLIVAESMDSEMSGFVRIHEKVMEDLGIGEEGFVEIEYGGKKVKSSVMPHLASERIIRVPLSLRELLRAGTGDEVVVRASSVKEASLVLLSELPDLSLISLLRGRVVNRGEKIRIASRVIEVLECHPESSAVISERTRILCGKN